jgi:hypothetical protein
VTATGTDRVTAPTRRLALVAAALAALLLTNLAVYGIGRALGGAFVYRQDGLDVRVESVAVTLLTLGPLTSALIVVALLARKWPAVISVARIAGPALAVLTIGVMTIPAGFDTTSAVCLAVMHLATVPAMLFALNTLRR